MKKYFYVAADYEKNPKEKNFNIWEFVESNLTEQVIKAIDTVFYLNKKYEGIALSYGFTNLEKDELMIELNK